MKTYFPQVDLVILQTKVKMQIEEEINPDFANVYYSIKQLPVKARFGVYIAYKYYLSLFKKIKQTQPAHIATMNKNTPIISTLLLLCGRWKKSAYLI